MNLLHDFARQARTNPDCIALALPDQHLSYAGLVARIRQISGWLLDPVQGEIPERVGILGERSLDAYAAMLACSWAGLTWVPLIVNHPAAYLDQLINQADLNALLFDNAGSKRLKELDALITDRQLQLDTETLSEPTGPAQPVETKAEHTAYLVFTSGTTGQPKGVPPSTGAVLRFMQTSQELFTFSPNDRVAQNVDMDFDPTLLNVFTPLSAGAEVHIMPHHTRLTPGKWLREHAITAFYCMPSLVSVMRQTHQLRAGQLPALRLTLFGGEVLNIHTVKSWQEVAPASAIVNYYGPSEVTVGCTCNFYDTAKTSLTPGTDTISIGPAFQHVRMEVAGLENEALLPNGESGEFIVSGEQIATHYWKNAQQTGQSFITRTGSDGRSRLWYRTGDLGWRDDRGHFHFEGRIDDQVQLFGHRLEPAEIIATIRAESGAEQVELIPWPIVDDTVQGLVAFIEADTVDISALKATLRRVHPAYLLPKKIIVHRRLPRTANGKIDRAILFEWCSD